MLERSATGYSFVTGFGSKPPMYPHHRQSAADDNEDPVPGFVIGGDPNPVNRMDVTIPLTLLL
ncbi:MAG: glycoside hydrolase family 9 protein [Balneolaceae bacterium]|nr:glycoside hydrolase family 9 protein [Balneolaceae bacterium]